MGAGSDEVHSLGQEWLYVRVLSGDIFLDTNGRITTHDTLDFGVDQGNKTLVKKALLDVKHLYADLSVSNSNIFFFLHLVIFAATFRRRRDHFSSTARPPYLCPTLYRLIVGVLTPFLKRDTSRKIYRAEFL